MKAPAFYVTIMLFTLSTSLWSQQQDLWTTFTTGDGLASPYVYAIIESSNGSLWFGTEYGASSYHQGIWSTFRKGLVNLCVRAIFESYDGAIWFGTDGGISRFFQGNWTSFTTDSGLANNHVRAICESHDGSLWFGTDGGGVSRYYKGKWSTFTTDNGLANNRVFAILESSDSILWFGTYGGGVSQFDQGTWTKFTTTNGLADNQISTIIESSDGALWFGTQGGVNCFKDGKWTKLTVTDGLTSNHVNAICESSDGALWFGGFGVSRYHKGTWKTFTADSGLVDNHVWSIVESSDESLWFGTVPSGGIGGGVSRYQERFSVIFTTDDGLAHNNVNSILETSDSSLWLGTSGGGASRYHLGKWTTFTTENGLINNDVKTIIESSHGALWFGTSGGVSCYSQMIWKNFTKEDGLGSNYVRSILESSDGAFWFATSEGVSRYYQGKWQTFTTVNGLVSNFITTTIESSDGAVWVGTGRGLNRFYQGTWTTITIPGGFADNDIQTMIESSDRALWIGTYEMGVRCYKDGIWSRIRGQLASESVNTITESSDGAIWIGTRLGVSRYNQGDWSNFTVSSGLASNFVNAIIESFDGGLWFGTKEGVSRLKPDRKKPKTFIIEGPQDNDIIGISTPLFIFNAVDRNTELAQLKFSWEILDSNRILISGDSVDFQNDTVIQPTISENGKYIFTVRARDAWGNVDPTPASRIFSVDITPPTITILSPRIKDIIAGEVAIIGSAYDNSPIHDFLDYQLNYAKFENPNEWLTDKILYKRMATDSIRNDTLAVWNTTGMANGNYWLHLLARDKLGHISHEFVPVEIASACRMIEARSGGYLCTESRNIEIYLPPNAIPRDQQIYVKDTTLTENDLIQDSQIRFAGWCFKLVPADIELLKPATLTISYSDSLIQDKLEGKLAIYYFDDKTQNWHRLGGTVNLEENKITTSFRQLGVFALYEDLTEGGKAGIFNINSQPRILSPQGGGHDLQTAISFELGKESNVTIKIYNPAGRLVKVLKENENTSHGNNVVYWDGKDQQGEFCVSGLYIVTIQAEEKMATTTVVVLNKY